MDCSASRTRLYVFSGSPLAARFRQVLKRETQMIGKTVMTPEERHRMIAETAYFMAHERGFRGGDPVADWIED